MPHDPHGQHSAVARLARLDIGGDTLLWSQDLNLVRVRYGGPARSNSWRLTPWRPSTWSSLTVSLDPRGHVYRLVLDTPDEGPQELWDSAAVLGRDRALESALEQLADHVAWHRRTHT